MTRDEMREALGKHRILSATLATKEGKGDAWLDCLADLAYYSKQVGIGLHGDPSVMKGEEYAMAQLPEKQSATLQAFFDARNSGARQDDAMTPEEKRIYENYVEFRTEYRSSSDSYNAAQSDLDVINGMKGNVGKGSILGFFGSGHLIGLNDLDELTTGLNGRATSVLIPHEPSSQHYLQSAIDRKKGDIEAPDFISDETSATLYKTTQPHERRVSHWLETAKEIGLEELAELPPPFSWRARVATEITHPPAARPHQRPPSR